MSKLKQQQYLKSVLLNVCAHVCGLSLSLALCVCERRHMFLIKRIRDGISSNSEIIMITKKCD